ncbi:MAG: MauE/DoxX family redox-associated membrane protein [Desulfomonilia bacterium]|jgi:putative oxidoreductase
MRRFRSLLPSAALVLVSFRIVLAAVFIYAGVLKVLDPAGFSEDILNYRLLPGWMVNPVAVVLPWVEIAAGLSLLSGVLLQGGALVITGLLAVFASALAISLARGLDISCGCFGASEQSITWWYLLRDLALLSMGAAVLLLPDWARMPWRRVKAGPVGDPGE